MNFPKYFSSLLTFYRKHGYLPSFREMLKLTGLKSTNAIAKHFSAWVKGGLLYKDHNGRFTLADSILGLPLLGTVEAGWPSAAEEELADTMDLDEFLIHNREATYMLTVSGESMIDAGINPKDLVLVERGREPKDGDIVIAEIDSGWTMKYFYKKGGQVSLEPANKKFKTIYPKNELKIAAVVTAVIRKYHS
ncbi:MAG: transcriptional repressor LexA [Patescibacteria group bacterium]|jgi:repressor LexA